MNERNHWITFPKREVIRWAAVLPPPQGNPDAHLRFMRTAVEAGKRHGVWDLQRLPGATPFNAAHQTFEDYAAESIRSTHRMPLFEIRAETPGDALWTPARLAFYRGDEIVEALVGDVGDLLRTLRPEKGTSFSRSTAPLTIRGVTQHVDSSKEATLTLRLDTDIWCPRVVGMDEPHAGEPTPDFYDNRALAAIHTPRLNGFLADLRSVTLEIGGRWEKREADSFGESYADQWDETGIRLP